MKLPIETPNPLFGLYLYPAAKEIMERQQDVSWTAKEIPVEEDTHDYRHNMSEAQVNITTITLQLFVEIEQKVGDVWEEVSSWYPHSEIDGACIEIARMEKAVHAFFYQKMSDVLNIDPEETAKAQQEIVVLKAKLEFLTRITSNLSENKALTLATVSAIEQVLLFSNFAMLKSFQSNGNNLIKNTITGVDFVVQDEQLHGEFAAYLFNTVQSEEKAAGVLTPEIAAQRKSDINAMMTEIIQHEDDVIDYTFSGAIPINDITAAELKIFIRSRANEVFAMLGYEPRYDESGNTIGKWFYKSANSIKVHDFFAGGTNQYRRGWAIDGFSRLPHIEETTNV